MFHLCLLLAQNSPQGGENGGGGLFGGQMIWFLFPALMFLFYFVVIRPAQRQERERQALAKNIKKNDKVLTSAGIYGTVTAVSEEEDVVTVKVDDNVRLKMVKSSIIRNLSNEETLQEQKDSKDKK